MAKRKSPKSTDGLEKIGIENGLIKYRARLKKRDKRGKHVDTKRIFLAENKADALRQRDALQAQLLAEKNGERPALVWTVQEAFDAFLPTLRTGSRTTWTSHGKKICAAFGSVLLGKVRVEAVQQFLLALDVADDTANNIRQCFKRLFDFAKTRGAWAGKNPIEDVVRRSTPKTDEEWLAELEAPPVARALLEDDLSTFLAAFRKERPDLYTMVLTQLLLGCRFGEVSALEWRDIDFDHAEGCTVVVRRAQYKTVIGPPKSKKARQSAVGPAGRELLLQHRQVMAELQWPGWQTLVFPRPVGGRGRPTGRRKSNYWAIETVTTAIRKTMEDLGLQVAARTHAMRHSMISAVQDAQTDLMLRKLVGHSSEAMTRRYTTVADAKILSFAGAVERKLLAAKAEPTGGTNGGNTAQEVVASAE